MKKIEAFISDEKIKTLDKVCEKECYTRAEFLRRAIDEYLKNLQNINMYGNINIGKL